MHPRYLAPLVLGGLMAASATSVAAFDIRQFEGTTISVALAKQPWSDFITPLIPEFEEQTGITVRLDVLPEDQHRQKLAVSFVAGRGDVDVFSSIRHQEGIRYSMAGWYEPLGLLIANPDLTSPDFDIEDFTTQSILDATVNAELVGIPLYSEIEILMYRRDLFDAAGLAVPNTLAELEAAAAALTSREQGQYGLCLRGKGAATTTMFSGFLHSMGAAWADEDRNPTITTPEAIKAFEFYGQLGGDYGPPGLTNYHWFQCQGLVASGKAAMWIDTNIFAAGLLDPTQSEVADKMGFAMFPEGSAGRQPAGGGWYLSLAAASEKKGPSWYFMQWAVNKTNVLKAQLAGIPTARRSAWESEEFRNGDKFPDLSKATLDSLSLNATAPWGPPWVAVSEVRDAIGAVVITAIQGGDVAAAAEAAVRQIGDIRSRTEAELPPAQ